MSACEYVLLPNVNGNKTRGYLEIEVSKLNFITELWAANLNVNPNRTLDNCNSNSNKRKQNAPGPVSVKSNCTPIGSQGAEVKFIWWGECRERAARIAVGNQKCTHHRNQLTRKATQSSAAVRQLQFHNKVRYSVRTNQVLFVDYLFACEPIEICIVTNTSNLCWGQVYLRLSSVLLRKYATHYPNGCAFEYKTEIYAIYKPHQQQRTGEIQLLFRMLFAPSAKLQEHLTTLQRERNAKGLLTYGGGDVNVTKPRQGKAAQLHNDAQRQQQAAKGSIQSSKPKEIVEAMKKLDAKLVAYLAGEDMSPLEEKMAFERLRSTSPVRELVDELTKQQFREQQLEVFKRISSVKLQMEALTLQPEGTKRMELLQSEIRPIFTVECQLSHELIKNVPRYDMFHIMQFESEKFQSLTQCTRFGQEAERNVKLDFDEHNPHVVADVLNGNMPSGTKLNFGRIHFTVWWREPGTCLNEMLGMGVLELEELFNASLLEQCKRIAINRRNVHLASLYLKISLRHAAQLQVVLQELIQQKNHSNNTFNNKNNNNLCYNNKHMLNSTFSLMKICNDGDSKKSVDKSHNPKAAEALPSANAAVNPAAAATSSALAENNKNNNLQLESSNFSAETSKVRLLKGFIYANEMRNLCVSSSSSSSNSGRYYLVCRRFWQEEAIATQASENNSFNYQEQFAVINDEQFLKRVDKQHLQLEVWQQANCDDNGNSKSVMDIVGVVRLPLHQFFIAYRDAAITNHLCKSKLPVISIDAWAAIVNCQTGAPIGELQCLLAIGSEEQITNLKDMRSFTGTTTSSMHAQVIDVSVFEKDLQESAAKCAAAGQRARDTTETLNENPNQTEVGAMGKSPELKKTSDLMDMLQKALMSSQQSQTDTAPAPPTPTLNSLPSQQQAVPSAAPFKLLQPANVKSFKFLLDIQSARGLPLNPANKGKKGSKRNSPNTGSAQKRFPANEPPSTYVTFQADEGYGTVYQSHEGVVYATNIVEKCTQPAWQQRFRVSASVEYLTNAQKRFILKIWKKACAPSGDIAAQSRPQPSPKKDDAIIGFAALDLSVFLRGMFIAGWFNIVDFNGRITGQLEVRCQPLEDLSKMLQLPAAPPANVPLAAATTSGAYATTGNTQRSTQTAAASSSSSMDAVIDQFESSLDLTHLNLGQAIKRKFTELEEISQRLRTRLVDVTGEPFAEQFNISALNNWTPLNAMEDNDLGFDEFERDINTSARPSRSPSPGPIPSLPSEENNETKAIIILSSHSPPPGAPPKE